MLREISLVSDQNSLSFQYIIIPSYIESYSVPVPVPVSVSVPSRPHHKEDDEN